MNIASALIKQVLTTQDFETWSYVRKEYLPSSLHKLFSVIQKHCSIYHSLPTFEDLQYSIRDSSVKEKLYLVEATEVHIEASHLLDYLKNEYTQSLILDNLESYIDNSIAFETAEESLQELHQIVLDVESKVDLEKPQENMQKISLFEDDEELDKYLPLGLNTEYDYDIKFSPRDLILVGGRRGAGKSITCSNIANNVYDRGKIAIYFTIEMDSRSILQRSAAIGANVPYSRLKTKSLSNIEWERVAAWWSGRFVDGEVAFNKYKEHRSFDDLQYQLTTEHALHPEKQIDVIYDPSLTISKIQTVLDKKVKSTNNVGVVIVDYLNQVRRSMSAGGQYDWTEQIEVSKALKAMAQEYEVPFFSPYQTDTSGEARFAKGILDAADAAYTLETWSQEDECITFNCVKMRSAAMKDFTSTMNWENLKIGPEPTLNPKERSLDSSDESIDDI